MCVCVSKGAEGALFGALTPVACSQLFNKRVTKRAVETARRDAIEYELCRISYGSFTGGTPYVETLDLIDLV